MNPIIQNTFQHCRARFCWTAFVETASCMYEFRSQWSKPQVTQVYNIGKYREHMERVGLEIC